MDFNHFIRNEDKNNLCTSFDITKKPLYICRPYRGVEQYPSTRLRAGYLLYLGEKIINNAFKWHLYNTSRGRAVGSSSGS